MGLGQEVASEEYILGAGDSELARLIAQAEIHRPDAEGLLDRVPIDVRRALDVGCGPLGVLDLLSERVGIAGEVVGLDNESQDPDDKAGSECHRQNGDHQRQQMQPARAGSCSIAQCAYGTSQRPIPLQEAAGTSKLPPHANGGTTAGGTVRRRTIRGRAVCGAVGGVPYARKSDRTG